MMSNFHLVQRLVLTAALTLFFSLSNAQTPLLTPEKVIQLLPDEIRGFDQSGDAKGSTMKLGDITYSFCEKNFSNYNKTIKILLFDFKEAPIMYRQATRRWENLHPVESDSLILRMVEMENCTGWESFNRGSSSAQIFLGVCDRFFLTIFGEHVDLAVLQKVVADIKPAKFPK